MQVLINKYKKRFVYAIFIKNIMKIAYIQKKKPEQNRHVKIQVSFDQFIENGKYLYTGYEK